MKSLLLALMIFIPLTASAGLLEGMILGSLLTPSTRTTKVVVMDEFTKQISVMEDQAQSNLDRTVYETLIFKVDKENAVKFRNYFENKGYKAKLVKGELVLDFKSEYVAYSAYLERRAQQFKENQEKAQAQIASIKSFFNKAWPWALGIFVLIGLIQSINNPAVKWLWNLEKELITDLAKKLKNK